MTATVPGFLVSESLQILLEQLNPLRLPKSWHPTTAVPPATLQNNGTGRFNLRDLLQHHQVNLNYVEYHKVLVLYNLKQKKACQIIIKNFMLVFCIGDGPSLYLRLHGM